MRPLFLLVASVGLVTPQVAAQDASLNVLLFEKSYAGVGTPHTIGAPSYYARVAEPGLLAEAQIAPHLALHRKLDDEEIRFGWGRGFNVFLTPQIRLRGYDVPSGPVKSISFMPKFTLQWLWSRGRLSPNSQSPGPRHIYGVSLVLGHHSNGGSTCEFTDQVLEADGQCVFSGPGPLPHPSDREVWVNGGNFSTNYIELGGGYRYGVTRDAPTEHWKWFLEGAAAYQHHHTWFGFPLPGGADEAFGALYGLDRLRFDVAGHYLLNQRLALRGSGRLDVWNAEAQRFEGARNYTLESDVFLQYVANMRDYLPSILGLGLRYSRGQDYYNTQYVRDISHLQLVAIIDLWSPIF